MKFMYFAALLLCAVMMILVQTCEAQMNEPGKEGQSITNAFLRGEGVECRNALRELEHTKNAKVLARGLRRNDVSLKLDIVDALERVGDKNVLPDLLEALKTQNVIAEGSSDTVVPERKLKERLIQVIQKMSGLELPITDYDNRQEIRQTIEKVEKELRKQKAADTNAFGNDQR